VSNPATSQPPSSEPAWRAWWRLARPFSLTASIVPTLVGTAVAVADGTFRSFGLLFAMLVASILIQIATNMFNEYYDYRRGLDTPETIGIAGTIVRGITSPTAVFSAAAGCFAAALALGIIIVLQTDPWVFAVGVLCALAGYAYTGGPWPIAYTPLGELEVFIFMGPIMVGLSYFIQAGQVTESALWASAPVACLVAAILLANNVRDMVPDARSGRSTLPIVAGKPTATVLYAVLVLGAYAATAAAIVIGRLPPTAILSFFTAASAVRLIRGLATGDGPAALNPIVRGSAGLHARFGLLHALGIAVAPLTGWLLIS
jgi:1,4-dihydroxy-2-naphthoate octaprenyltransferase